MLSFVCWKWRAHAAPDRSFQSKHVNVLRSMVARHYPRPFRFVCITDDTAELDPRIDALPLPVRFDELRSPQGKHFPNCYCRLWNFSRQATILGERIFQIDIDVVITGDLRPLVDRDEDFVGWCDKGGVPKARVPTVPRFRVSAAARRARRLQATIRPEGARNKIAGGAYLLRTGALPHVWEQFDPQRSPAQAFAAGNLGSDQGWMSLKLYPCASFGDGLVKINWTPPHATAPPAAARIVFSKGTEPPWSKETQEKYPWIKDHWKI